LKRYRIEADYIEELGKVKKIYTKKGTFALKRTAYTEEQRNQFLKVVQSLHGRGYRHVVPIFPTDEGKYLLRDHQYDYYLMPWLESKRSTPEDSYGDLMREAARMHAVTEIKGKANQPYLLHFYEQSKLKLDRRKLDYERFIEKSEKKVYMSPFELLFCTYFIQFMRIEDAALDLLENWYETVKEKKQDRISICHGNLTPKHLVYDENRKGHLINFEKTFTASPIYDLLHFYRKLLYRYPQKSANAIQLYSEYNRYNRLTEDERLLLFYYLAQTEKIQRLIYQYQSNSQASEKDMVVKLQRSIWQMQASHTFITQINEAIQQEKEKQLQAEPENNSIPS